MEFPSDVNVFDAVDFETAVPRNTGRTTVELLAQARPTGRIADHYRLAMAVRAFWRPSRSCRLSFQTRSWMASSWSTSSGARTYRSGEI